MPFHGIRYISKGATFDAGSEAFLIEDYRDKRDAATMQPINQGMFQGLIAGQRQYATCNFDEFLVVTDTRYPK